MAHVAFEDAITKPDNVDEDSYKDFTEVLRKSAVKQFIPDAGDDPFGKVKGLITDLTNRVLSEITVMKFGASADKDQFAPVKAVIRDLITRLQAESLSEISHESHWDEEMHEHIMQGTLAAEARQPHRGSKQQPAKQAAQDREKRKKEEREGKLDEKGRVRRRRK